jgi:hypothetical protein
MRMHRIGLLVATVPLLTPTRLLAEETRPEPPSESLPDAREPVSNQPWHETPAIAELRAELSRQRVELKSVREQLSTQAAPPAVSVQFSGFVQVDWVVLSQASHDELSPSTGLPLNQERFTLRRGHLRAEAERKWFGAALEIDANTTRGAQVRPIAAEVFVRYPEKCTDSLLCVTGSAGLMRIPFGFEVQEKDSVRPFLERAQLLRALFPGEFDMGARLAGRFRFLELAVAIMNGHPIGEQSFPALAPNHEKDIVARLGTNINVTTGVRLDLGISTDTGTGFHAGTATTKDELTWRDENGDGIVQATEIQIIPGRATTASQKFHRYAVGADARVSAAIPVLGTLALRAEIAQAVNLDRGLEPADPVGAGYDLREFGWLLGVTQEVTEYAAIGIRYDRYNPDQDATDPIAATRVPKDRTYSTAALMGMVRHDNVRVLLEYDKNANALGRTASGAPTTLKNDFVTLRAQVTF